MHIPGKFRRPDSQPGARTQEREPHPESFTALRATRVAAQLERDGRFAEAIRYLERAISRCPEDATLYNALAGLVARTHADLDRAMKLLSQALELSPNNPVYLSNIASVLREGPEALA